MALQWYRTKIRVTVEGAARNEIPGLLSDMQEELKMRLHIRNPFVDREVIWKDDDCQIETVVESQGVNSSLVADMVGEELLEVSAAFVPQMKRVGVEVIDVQPI